MAAHHPASQQRAHHHLSSTVPAAPSPRTVLRGRALTASGMIDDATIAVAGSTILFAGTAADFVAESDDDILVLTPGQIIVPGLIDLHCHGAFGVDFSTTNAHDARIALRKLHALGTTSIVASLVTASPDELAGQLTLLAELVDEGLLAGLHLEGPFLARARCGAQDPRCLSEPDSGVTQRLIDSARGHLTTMTYAPELPGSDYLLELLTSHGVVPSLGHTACSTTEASASLQSAQDGLLTSPHGRGRSRPTVTHLFNAMDPLHHRAPGALAACLRAAKAGNAVVELIADNTHLHPDLVVMMFDLVGAGNIALVTDSMAASGLTDGQYRLGPAHVTVNEGVARLATSGAIAGGTASMLELVRNSVQAGVSLDDAVTAAAAVPSDIIGSSSRAGRLQADRAADLLILDDSLETVRVMRHGHWLDRPPKGSISHDQTGATT